MTPNTRYLHALAAYYAAQELCPHNGEEPGEKGRAICPRAHRQAMICARL